MSKNSNSKQARKFSEDDNGAVLMEFVMVLPMMLMLIGFLVSMGQILIVQSAGYYGAYVAAREAMLPSANVSQAQSDGQAVMGSAPFGKTIHANVVCTVGGQITTCTSEGYTNLAFPVLTFKNSVLPTSSFKFLYSVSVPTERLN